MPRPVIYLDVDGVLNAFNLTRGTPPKDCFTDFELHPEVCGWPVYLSKQMAQRLAALDADVLWLTTWLSDAPDHLAPLLDLPSWDWLDWKPDKVSALIEDQLDNPRPFVWIDDDELGPYYRDRNLAILDQLEVELPPHLLVAPSPKTGIRPSELEAIEWFISEFSHVNQHTDSPHPS